MTRRFWLWFAVILLVSAALLFGGLGATPLTDRDEGEYAATVQSMARQHEWIVPMLGGRPYLEKPVLIYWAIAGSWHAFGVSAFSTRLPSALAALLAVAAIGWLVRIAVRDEPVALRSMVALATMPMFVVYGRLCLTDMPLVFATTVALLTYFIGLERLRGTATPANLRRALAGAIRFPRTAARPWIAASWAAIAAGILAKGPVTPAIVLPVAMLYAASQRQFRTAVAHSSVLVGAVVILAFAGPWYAAIYHRLGAEFIQGFFGAQVVTRATSALLGHGGPLWFYLPVLLVGAGPIGAAMACGFGRAARRCRRPGSTACDRLRVFAAVAVAVTLVVFTAAATKLPHYVLPAFPFAAILATGFLPGSMPSATPRAWAAVFFGLLLLITAALVALVAAFPLVLPRAWPRITAMIHPDSSEYALPGTPPAATDLAVAMAVIAVLTVVAAWTFVARRSGRHAALALSLGGGVESVLILLLVARVLAVIQEPAVHLARELRPLAGPPAQVLTYGLWKPTLLFYLDRDLPRLRAGEPRDEGRLQRALRSPDPVFVFTRAALLEPLRRIDGFGVLAVREGYALAGNAAAHRAWRSRALLPQPHAAGAASAGVRPRFPLSQPTAVLPRSAFRVSGYAGCNVIRRMALRCHRRIRGPHVPVPRQTSTVMPLTLYRPSSNG